jgi:hypothetical protein
MEDKLDRLFFGTLLAGLAAEKRAQLTKAQLDVMWLGLQDLTRGELEDAVRRAVLGSRFFPNVSELRELAGKPRQRRHGVMRLIGGKPHTFMEGRGWAEFHGPASWFDDGPSPIGDGMEGLLRLEAPPAPGERGR